MTVDFLRESDWLASQLLEGDDWTPGPEHIAWFQQLWRSVNDGGTWAVPGSFTIWVFDKKQNAMVLKIGDPEHPLNQRSIQVAKAAGVKVILPGGDPTHDQTFAESQ